MNIPAITSTKIQTPFGELPDQTNNGWFNPKAMFSTEFGLAEGYFRRTRDTPEYISWKEGKEVYVEGFWKKPVKQASIPWPLQRTGSKPAYFQEFIEKLLAVEQNLKQCGSYLKDEMERECLFCQYTENSCHYVLKLDAYDPPTEIRWPSMYTHYLIEHNILPSKMFVLIFLEYDPSSTS